MKKILLLLVFTFLVNPIFPQNQWVKQTNGIDYLFNAAIDASDSLNAVIGGSSSKIILTTNSGNNWIIKDYGTVANSQTEKTVDISMIDKDHIWLGTENGKILSTNDGGSTWQLQFYDTTVTSFINYIKMFDLQNGVAMGDPKSNTETAVILKTTDGGTNWITYNISYGGLILSEWRRIDFVNNNTGYFFKSMTLPYNLYKTTDGGVSWDTTNFSQVSSYLTLLKFYDENIGFAYVYGEIFFTLDGGNSWDSSVVSNEHTGSGDDIVFIKNNNSFTIALSAGNNIYFSSDTGKTWSSDSTFYNSGWAPLTLCFPDNQHGWVLTGAGGRVNAVYYKNNGIITGINNRNILPNMYSISQNFPNPFNPSTIIQYYLPFKSYVSVVVYNILGEVVTKLVEGNKPAGIHKIHFDGTGLSSGIYLYSIRATSIESNENFLKVRKMVLLK